MGHISRSVHLPAESSLTVTASAFNSTTIRLIENSETDVHTILKNRTIRIGPFSLPRQYRLSSESNSFSYTVDDERLAYNHEGTGLFNGGEMSINALDATKIDIAAGLGVVVDNYTNPEIPNVIHITWPDLVGVDVEFLASDFGSSIAIDRTGQITQFPASGGDIDKRDNVFLGILGHSNLTTVTSIASAPTPGYDQTHMLIDLADALGLVNKSGNIYSANGTNLKINKSAGQVYAVGYNHANSAKQPNVTTDAASTATSFFTGYRDGLGGFTVGAAITDVPVANYDDNSGTLAAIPASDPWTIFRIVYFPAIDNHVMLYGQNLYKTQKSAEAAIFGEAFDLAPEVSNGIIRAYLITKNVTTDLSDLAEARFIEANLFGGSPAGGVSTATTDLQGAYDNSETPEITTNDTLGAFTVKEGTGTATNNVIEVTNNSDALVYRVDGQGRISGAIEGAVTGSRPVSPINYQMFFDTTLGIPIWYDGVNWIDAAGTTV